MENVRHREREGTLARVRAGLQNLRSVLMTIKRGRVYPRTAFVPLVKDDITDR